MVSRRSPAIMLTVIAAVVGLALSACGSDSLSTPTPVENTVARQSVDPALAAMLPPRIKAAGVIVIGIDTSYPPNDFLAPDGMSAQGVDVDLFNAVAQRLGVKTQWISAVFDTVILGVKSGKFDVGVSSVTITPKRMKENNMVSYYTTGTQWVTLKGNPKRVDPDNACGLNIGVQKATVQIEDLAARSKKCTEAGKKAINPIVDELQVKVNADVVSGKADAMAADTPVGIYAVKQTNGLVEPIGKAYNSTPYGYVLPKDETEFAQALADALKSIDASGDYMKILKKWNIEAGAIHNFAVNP